MVCVTHIQSDGVCAEHQKGALTSSDEKATNSTLTIVSNQNCSIACAEMFLSLSFLPSPLPLQLEFS